MPIDPILTLPYELVAEVLTDWLKLESVVHLDSAYCKRSIRHHFLQMLSWRRLKLFSTTKSKASFILWMLARKIKISSLVCTRTLCMAEVSRSVKKADSTVRKVVLNCLSTKDAAEIGAIIAYHCTNIRILRIIECMVDLSFQNILEKNKELRELLLSACTNLEKYSLQGIKCPKLEKLCVDATFIGMTMENYEAFLGLSKNLQQFTFPYVQLPKWTPLALKLNQLRSLSFSAHFPKANESDVINIAHSFPSVTNLSLPDATDGLVLAMARNCAVIRTLSLEGYNTSFTPLSLQVLASHHALSLQVLYLNHCPCITNTAVMALLRRCRNLHTLSVDEVDDEEFNKLILSSALMESIHDHPALTTLLISGEYFIAEETIHALSLHGSKLTTLGINCSYYFDQFTSMLEKCTALRTLYLPKARPGHAKKWRAVNPKLIIHSGARVSSVFAYKCSNYPMYLNEVSESCA